MQTYRSMRPKQVIRNALKGVIVGICVTTLAAFLTMYIFTLSNEFDGGIGNNGYSMVLALLLVTLEAWSSLLGWPWSLLVFNPQLDSVVSLLLLGASITINFALIWIIVPIIKEAIIKKRMT